MRQRYLIVQDYGELSYAPLPPATAPEAESIAAIKQHCQQHNFTNQAAWIVVLEAEPGQAPTINTTRGIWLPNFLRTEAA